MTNEIPTIQEVIIDMLKQGIERIDKARAKLREDFPELFIHKQHTIKDIVIAQFKKNNL
jgi:hypothetical protein